MGKLPVKLTEKKLKKTMMKIEVSEILVWIQPAGQERESRPVSSQVTIQSQHSLHGGWGPKARAEE